MAETPEDSSYDFAKPENIPATRQRTEPPKVSRVERQPEHTCPYCGFSFLGKPKARCPECSAPMESGTTDLLQFVDDRWVRGVAIGLMLMAAPIGAHAVGALLRWTNERPVEATVHAAAAVALAVTVFMVTRREQGKGLVSAALYSRVMAIAAGVAWVLLGLIALELMGSHGMTKALVLLALASQGVMGVLLGFYCSGLAARVPDDTLSSHSVYVGWLMAAVCGLLMAIQFLGLTTIYHLMFFMCSFPMIAGLLVCLLWAIITLLRLGLNMLTSARAGEAITLLRRQRMTAKQS